MKSKEKGNAGEVVAQAYLEKLGYRFVMRNFRTRYGELDLVFRDPEGIWVFVEVKNFQNNSMIHPLEYIQHNQVHKLQKAAQVFIMKRNLMNDAFRFDAVLVNGEEVEEHYLNLFSC